ncbi:MAG: DUF1573 domain-containing protein [Candidatus Zixiibacteriota bacterium]|nr:MAG: DUF1573 domain-containing protein [candidate division Zixibacteria bacterium]
MRIHHFLTIAILSSMASTSQAGPDLRVRSERFEMGAVQHSTWASHAFWFRSTGDDTLVIHEIKTNCGCTLMPLERNWIAPGDSLRVDICWDVWKRIGATGSYPYIYTNAGVDPFRVYLTATVIVDGGNTRPLAFNPHIFELPRFGDRSIDSVGFTIRNFSDEEVRLKPVSFFVDECDIVLPEVVAGKGTAKGYIKVRNDFLDSEFKRSITIEMNDQKENRLTIPIRRKIY